MKRDAKIDDRGSDKAGGLWLPTRTPERAADCLRNIRRAIDEGACAEDYIRRCGDERAMLVMEGLMTPAGDWAVPILDDEFAAKFGVGAGSERAVVYLALVYYWGTDAPRAWAAGEVASWFDGFYDAIKHLDCHLAEIPLAILAARWGLAVSG